MLHQQVLVRRLRSLQPYQVALLKLKNDVRCDEALVLGTELVLLKTPGLEAVAVGKDERNDLVGELAEPFDVCCPSFVELVQIVVDHRLHCLKD